MSASDDGLGAEVRRTRASLDDQRYSKVVKMTPMSSPTVPAVTPRTYHLPILRPGGSVTSPNTETHALSTDQLYGRSSDLTSDGAGPIPDAIASASFSIAGVYTPDPTMVY